MQKISVCLSDLPKERIETSKNGKKYISLIIAPRKEADKYGNDLTVYINQTKEDRENKAEKVYVGNGKEMVFDNKQQIKAPVQNVRQTVQQPFVNNFSDEIVEDLPF